MNHKFFGIVLAILFFVIRLVHAQEKIPLEQVIAMALDKNYDVQLWKNTAAANKTSDSYSWGLLLPQLNAVGTDTWTSNKQTLRFNDVTKNNSGTNEANNVSASVQLNWTLFDGTKMFATRQRLAVIVEQGELFVKDQMVNTVASVINNYYNVVRQKQQLRAIQELMAVSEERVKLAEKKLQVGTGAKPELLQAKVDYNTQRTQVFQQEAAIRQLKEQLNGLVGSGLPSNYDVSDSIEIDLGITQADVLENVENSNFTLQAARRNFNIARLALHERRGELLPTLSFTSSYNYSRQDNTKLINPFNTIYSLTNGYNYGFAINIPILNFFNTRRNVDLAKVTLDRQQVLYDQLKMNINVGVRNAYTNYDYAKQVLIVEEETVALAKENVYIALESFKRGVVTYIELRTAQQSLADAYNSFILARYNAKLAETELLRLNGRLLK